MATIKYSSNTETKTVNVPFVFGGTLTARGNGSTTVRININPTTTGKVLTVTGNARLYTNQEGTLGESTSKTLTHQGLGSAASFFIKLTSGTATWYINTKQIDEFSTQEMVAGDLNCPKIGGDFSNWVTLKTFGLRSRVNFTSSVTKMCNSLMKSFYASTSYNEGIVTGDLSGAIHTTQISLKNHTDRIAPNLMYVTCHITSAWDGHPWLELSGNYALEAMYITGDLTPVDPVMWYGEGSIYLTANASSWTHCYYIETDGAFTATTIAGMTKCGYFQPTVVMSETQVNQFLADLRANVAVVKGYAPSETLRTFDLRGAVGTAAPTGQGLIDKQFLIDWTDGGRTNNVYTR
jgi:hypothetical protein